MDRGPDRTAKARVAAYRQRQVLLNGLVRFEVRVSARDREGVRRLAEALRNRRAALLGNRHMDLVLGTVNAPRPHPIDANGLLDCLLAERADPRWVPHVQALFTEVGIEPLHWLVLSGVCTFADLRRAAIVWEIEENDAVQWISEMDRLALGLNAAQPVAHTT